ncbi:hypothetical protein A0257_18715 [Hymenobacter psoromatis]|nr:hypothetical protein A0257_18715 [Hymenobacter psoromatis]
MKTTYFFRLLAQRGAVLLGCVLLAASCQKTTVEAADPTAGRATVLAWNQASTVAVTRMTNPTTGFFVLPHVEARAYAIVSLAMYDALNNIQQKNTPYALHGPLVPDASPDAAVCAAAHDALMAVLPTEQAYADSLYQAMLGKIGTSDAKTKGVALGQAAAKAILAKRANDGSDNAQIPITINPTPGSYQYTPPFDGPPFNGYYALDGWKSVKPFVLAAANQFRPGPPPVLTSADYTTNFNEVKSIGGATSTVRTADQSASALFWLDNSGLQWNRVARAMLTAQNADTYATVRLLALLQMSLADTYVAVGDAKSFYMHWRPVTAIRQAATDGNPDTAPDAAWLPFAFPNPPDADYPSAHAAAGAAAATVLKGFFGADAASFSITNNAGKTRSYTSFSQASDENALSRVYAGYHFRDSSLKGQVLGTQLGNYVAQKALP